jgi:hypothetical protein
MSSHTLVNKSEKPVFWFTPGAKTNRSEYDQLLDEAENTLHLITPNDSMYPLLRLKKVYLEKSNTATAFVTSSLTEGQSAKNRLYVFVIEGAAVKNVNDRSTHNLDQFIRAFTNKTHHLWIESMAKTISGKLQKIGTLKGDDNNWVNLNVNFRKLLAKRIGTKAFNPQLVNAFEIIKRREALLKDNEFLEAKEIAELFGSKADNLSSFAYNAKRARKIFSVTEGRKCLYPLFQFDLKRGEIRKEVSLILKELPESWSDWDIAFWFFQGNSYLGNKVPSEMFESAAVDVINAAKYERDKLNG